MVDAKCTFLLVEASSFGKVRDAGMLQTSHWEIDFLIFLIFFPINVKPETVDLINIVCVAACTTLSEIGSYVTTLTMVKSKKLNMSFQLRT